MHYILSIIITAICLHVTHPLHLDHGNKFQNLLVYINDDVAEGDGSLLDNIQSHINKASMSLLKATGAMKDGKAGVQFGTVYIRIPMNWRARGRPTTWQQCNKANFLVTSHRDNNNRMEPFTKQLGKCGDKGEFTRFSEEFFNTKNERELFNAGKKIMTEFVKLRYGVFSERPVSNILTVFTGMGFINSTCGRDVRWTLSHPMPICSSKNNQCRYTIEPEETHTHSVMFDSDTPSSEYFCNDHGHNAKAHSAHNIRCNRHSVSSVILRHKDFRKNMESQEFSDVNFVIVKGHNRKIALVIDVSESMKRIIDNVRKGCAEYISNFVEESASVGLATFNDRGTIMSHARTMKSNNKLDLSRIIKSLQAYGTTNIPAGIAKGIEILGSKIDNDDKVFGTILLVSGSVNTDEDLYTYDFAIRQVIKKGIVVNVISYGNLADYHLNKIATESGGEYVYADPNKAYSDIVSRFAKRNPCEQVSHQRNLIENTFTMAMSKSQTRVNLITLDKHIGRDVSITVTFNQDISRYTISLLDPYWKSFSPKKSIKQASGTTLTFFIPNQPIVGLYKLQTTAKTHIRYQYWTSTALITFHVSATPLSRPTRIINPTGQLSNSEVESLTDHSMIHATIDMTTSTIEDNDRITVTLRMTTPSDVIKLMPMTDDGIGHDIAENDKIFTRTLIAREIQEHGFYNFLAFVKIFNTETKEVISRTVELGSLRVRRTLRIIRDKVSPAKIEDVNVVVVNSEKNLLNIEIIATGNDGMMGKISLYDIRITSENGAVNLQRSVSKSPGTKLKFHLDLSDKDVNNPFHVVVRGVDDAGNVGEWSLPKTSNWNYETIAQKYFFDNNNNNNRFDIIKKNTINDRKSAKKDNTLTVVIIVGAIIAAVNNVFFHQIYH